MGFVDSYLNNNKLPPVSDKVKKRLGRLEEEMKQKTSDAEGAFEDCLSQFEPDITDISGRLAEKLSDLHVGGIGDAIEMIKFAKNMGFEIYQLVINMKSCVIPPDLSPDQEKERILDFGQDLAWFIWMIVDPLKGKFLWIPFRKKIEEILVRWIAGMGMELAWDVFDNNKKKIPVVSKSSKNKTIVMKALL